MSDQSCNRFLGFLIVLVVAPLTSCREPSGKVPTPVSQPSAFDQLRQAAESNDWTAAWKYSEPALLERDSDAATLDLASQAAYNTGHQDIAVDLLLEAYYADSDASPQRLSRTLSGLMSAGRYFDSLSVLRDAVDRDSANHELRKLLIDSLLGVERHHEASVHLRSVIQARAFDAETLLSFRALEHRAVETEVFLSMTQLYPRDKRPLIGVAKSDIDRGNQVEARQTLLEIVEQHPEDSYAQAMLGRVLIFLEEFEQLNAWFENQPDSIVEHPDYWLTLGDWAIHRGDQALGVQAYGEAVRLIAESEVHHSVAWIKLASVASLDTVPAADLDRIQNQANLWSRHRQLVAEYRASQQRSISIMIDIAQVLHELGRDWEAEAWTAVGMTMPSGDAMKELRTKIVARLNKTTPWQRPSVLPSWDWLNPGSDRSILAKLGGANGIAFNIPGRMKANSKSPSMLPRLNDEAAERGLVFFGRTADGLDQAGVMGYQMMGCGGGVIDYDLDGWPDLYLVTAGGMPPKSDSMPNALFRNRDGRFAEVTTASGGADRGFGQGVAVGDVNEDGFDDVFVLNYGPNRLYLNNGDGTFSNHPKWIPAESTWSTSGAIADIDGDGISDVVAVNYCAGLEPTIERCEVNGSVRACSPNHFAAQEDTFLKGTPEGGFRLAADLWNARPAVQGRGLGIVAGSLNAGLGIDLLIANDMTSNHFWTKSAALDANTAFRLAETASLTGLAMNSRSQPQGSMGIAVADFNDDRRIDFYVSNYEREYNTLYLSQGDSGWKDATHVEQLVSPALPMVGFGSQAIDLDNNSEQEIIVANGHVDLYDNIDKDATYEQPCQLFQRDLGGDFLPVGDQLESTYFQNKHVGRALWKVDANRDGKLDIVVTHQTEPVTLLINTTPTQYATIAFQLVGLSDLRTAVGGVVSVTSQGRTVSAPVTSGDGFLCSSERLLHFGLGNTVGPVKVSVVWPDGSKQTWGDIRPDGNWLLIQGQPPFRR